METLMPRVEYEVIWNGRNDGQGGDLLSDGLQRHAQVEAPKRMGYGEARQIMTDTFKAYGALAYRDLVAVTGLGPQTVNSSLHTMLANEVIEAVDGFGRPIDRSDRTNIARRYRLKGVRHAG